MTRSAFTPRPYRGKARESERIDLIVMLDEEFNILMKMEVLPVEQFRALLIRAEETGLTNLAAKIRKEIGDEIPAEVDKDTPA